MSKRLDQLRKKMTVQNTGSIASMLDFETEFEEIHAGRIMSEDTEHYVLVKSKPKTQDVDGDDDDVLKPSTSGARLEDVQEEVEEDMLVDTVLEVKGQSSSKLESDTGSDSKGDLVSSDKSKAISKAVKTFFAKGTEQSEQVTQPEDKGQGSSSSSSESKGQTGVSVIKQVRSDSKDGEIVIVSDDESESVSSSPPGEEDVEIIGGKKAPPPPPPPGKNMPSFFMSVMNKLVISALQDERGDEADDDEKGDEKPKVDDMKILMPGKVPFYNFDIFLHNIEFGCSPVLQRPLQIQYRQQKRCINCRQLVLFHKYKVVK